MDACSSESLLPAMSATVADTIPGRAAGSSFADADSLAASSDLAAVLTARQRSSRRGIYIASPAAEEGARSAPDSSVTPMLPAFWADLTMSAVCLSRPTVIDV